MLSAFRARGVLRTAATWAVALSTLATTLLIVGVEAGVVPSTVFGIRELVALAARTFVAGGLMGTLFALVVARRERGRHLGELNYRRFAVAGSLGGTTFGIAAGLAAPGLLPLEVVVASVIGFGLIGAGFSVATLALARRAAGLPVGRRLGSEGQDALPPVI